jgi:hypothetical protein
MHGGIQQRDALGLGRLRSDGDPLSGAGEVPNVVGVGKVFAATAALEAEPGPRRAGSGVAIR